MSIIHTHHLLMSSHDLKEGQCQGFEHSATNLFIVRHQGQVKAYINSCPHRKVPLEWVPNQFLDYDKQFIQCATHGAIFTIGEGLCISGPCNKQSLTALSVEEQEGGICLVL